MLDKKGAGFVSIITVIGAILIALGVVWLLAQNWHQIPAALKIIILVAFTLGAYITGIFLREKNYLKVSKSLFILGALLYTLSIFLIAQIFNLNTSFQGFAWLLLFAWLGVSFSAYLFNSYTTFIIAVTEFFIWLDIQFIALLSGQDMLQNLIAQTSSRGMPIIAAYTFLFLIGGIFFYGLGLLHRTYNHKFSGLFKWWTAFYFLVFAFILTLQTLMPIIWADLVKLEFSSNPMLFLFIFGAISILVFIFGIILAYSKKAVSSREIIAVLAIIIVLTGLIFLTKLPSNMTGACYTKTCYDFNEKSSCEASYQNLACEWKDTSSASGGRCLKTDCYSLDNQSSCEDTPQVLGCEWRENRCVSAVASITEDTCRDNTNKKQECLANSKCKWVPGGSYGLLGGLFGGNKSVPGILWFVWIVNNIFYVLLILAVIGYGSLEKSSSIINLGIVAFALYIIIKYIGFIAQFWGYTSLALIFITGGIILIFGGWLIERWRRNLVSEARGQIEIK